MKKFVANAANLWYNITVKSKMEKYDLILGEYPM